MLVVTSPPPLVHFVPHFFPLQAFIERVRSDDLPGALTVAHNKLVPLIEQPSALRYKVTATTAAGDGEIGECDWQLNPELLMKLRRQLQVGDNAFPVGTDL